MIKHKCERLNCTKFPRNEAKFEGNLSNNECKDKTIKHS